MPQVHVTAKVMFVLGTFLPAKRASKKGSTRFFLLPSPPNMSFIVCTNASSTGGNKRGRSIRTGASACSPAPIWSEHCWFSGFHHSLEVSYSEECPRLCTPSARAWPSGGSLQQAAADCSQCRPGHHSTPSSLPVEKQARQEASERPWAAGGTAVKFA